MPSLMAVDPEQLSGEKQTVLGPSSNSEFPSYEEYISHVLQKHEDQPSVRMQAKIMKKEINET
jgi:hypothetical protein